MIDCMLFCLSACPYRLHQTGRRGPSRTGDIAVMSGAFYR